MEIFQHIVDKAQSECGIAFGVLIAVVIGLAAAIKIVLTMWGTDRKNHLDMIVKMQENLVHAGENMDKIIIALASRNQATGD